MEIIIIFIQIKTRIHLEIDVFFLSQLEKSREAVDEANIRAAYAEVMTSALTEAADGENGVTKDSSGNYSKSVTLVQTQDGWQSTVSDIGGVDVSAKSPTAKGAATITYTASTSSVDIAFD